MDGHLLSFLGPKKIRETHYFFDFNLVDNRTRSTWTKTNMDDNVASAAGNGGTSNLNRRLTVDEVENHPELVTAENVGKQLSKRGNFYVVCLFIFFVFCVIIDLTRFASLCHAFSFRAWTETSVWEKRLAYKWQKGWVDREALPCKRVSTWYFFMSNHIIYFS